MNTNYSLGTALKNIRKNKGMSQEEVALEADITTAYYGMVERGVKSPTVRMLEKICRALDYPISEVFSDNVTCRTTNDHYSYQLLKLLEGRSDEEKEQLLCIIKQILDFNQPKKP